MTADDPFWSKVDKSGNCWLWTAAADKHGYGRFQVAGKTVKAHRYVLMLAGVDIDGLEVDHICHTPACVNPAHLRAATRKQNMEHRLGANRNSKSGIRGVYWDAWGSRWGARVQHNGRHHAKYFSDKAAAEVWAVAKRNELFTHNDADRISA